MKNQSKGGKDLFAELRLYLTVYQFLATLIPYSSMNSMTTAELGRSKINARWGQSFILIRQSMIWEATLRGRQYLSRWIANHSRG